MRRAGKRVKAKDGAKLPVAKSSRSNESSRVRDLEQRLAEALQREAAALDQQTATAEILRVISTSPTDVQPVFDMIVRSAAQLCDGLFGSAFRFDGARLHRIAHHNLSTAAAEALKALGSLPLDRDSVAGKAVLERAVVHVPDIEQVAAELRGTRERAHLIGMRAVLGVPMLKEGRPVGTIVVGRRDPVPFTARQIELLQTFADQAVIAIENVRLFTELQEKNRPLTEAHAQVTESLEQQTATSEILRVIASSPTDLQPVFDAILRSAVRLCDGVIGNLFRFDGELVHHVADYSFTSDARQTARRLFPTPPSRRFAGARAIFDRAVVHIPDVEFDPEYDPALSQAAGVRSALAMPMFREGNVVGTINVGRAEPGPFSPKQISLLQTFADQAVIAIENVRLFTELEARNCELTESLEQQTATSAILRIIASSPTELQPVMDTVAESAARFCGARNADIFRLEGDSLRLAARHGSMPGSVPIGGTAPLSPGTVSGRVIRERQTIHIEDFQALPETEYPETLARMRRAGVHIRTVLATPLLREGVPIGIIYMRRDEVHPFTEKQIELAKTFAAQAVIAIENVRLFKELEARNRELTESLEQQTATSEILRVISSSQTDIRPVFEAIAAKALDLCKALTGAVFRFDGELVHLAATHSVSPDAVESLRQSFPMPPSRGSGAARAVLSRATVYISDIREDPEFRLQAVAKAAGYLSVLTVPMLRQGQPIGAVSVSGAEAGAFSEKQVTLLQTFADQAVIAVENVRLFQELRVRTEELSRAADGAGGGRAGRQLDARPGDGADDHRHPRRPAFRDRRRHDL
jgi:two-component system NtrC family sensor kinase